MPVPRLIHPIDIQIDGLDQSTTIYDEDTREPIQVVSRSETKTVKGQVNWYSSMRFDPSKAGAREDSDGYIIFRVVDLDAQSITLQRGDKISKIGKRDCDVYITRIEPQGHYSDQGGATLLAAFFEDKQPSR